MTPRFDTDEEASDWWGRFAGLYDDRAPGQQQQQDQEQQQHEQENDDAVQQSHP